MTRRLGQLVAAALAGLVAAAVAKELSLPARARQWHGRIAGVPYDFRAPTVERVRSRMWNADDRRIFTPRSFGLGWDINLGRLWRLARG